MNPAQNAPRDEFAELVRNEAAQQQLKHNNHLNQPDYWLDLIMEEMGEIAKAINNGSLEYALHEAIDTAAACKNFFECLARGLAQEVSTPYVGGKKK